MQLTPAKRVAYNPSLLKLVRTLRLQRVLRRAYFHLARPANDCLEVGVGEVTARFAVRTPEELRLLESCGGAGGETQVLQAILSVLKPGDVAYDVGANVGLYSLLMAKAVGERGQVVAFEPEPHCYATLVENARLNRLANVLAVPLALGDRPGRARLAQDGTLNSFRVVELRQEADAAPREQATEVTDGDSYVRRQRLPVPRVVKIDVEGYEFQVLLGLRDTLSHPACKVVCCEVHPKLLPPDSDPEAVVSLVESLGFPLMAKYPRWDGTFHLLARKTLP